MQFDIDNMEGVGGDQGPVNGQLVSVDPIARQSNVDLVVMGCIGAGMVLFSSKTCPFT